MAKHFHVATSSKSGDAGEFEGDIPDEEWARLVRFAQCADRLASTGMVRDGCHVSVTLNADIREGIKVEGAAPLDDDLAAFLHRMRPFVLQDEATYFFKACNILAKYVAEPLFRRLLGRLRDLFSGEDFLAQIQIGVNNTLINTDEMLKNWLNADEYHGDEDKRRELEQLRKVFPEQGSRALFASMMMDKAKAVLEVARIVRAMEEGGGATTTHKPATRSVTGNLVFEVPE
jgi:hypothetical protein